MPAPGSALQGGPVPDLYAYGFLMVSAFLSATLLPGSSEAVLVGLLAVGQGQPAFLLAAASFGNVAGAVVNWLLGRFFSHYGDRAWFPVAPDTTARTRLWFGRYGAWSLLLSWVPVIGDPLTVVAGLMRVSFLPFVLIVAFAKGLRYAVIAASALAIL